MPSPIRILDGGLGTSLEDRYAVRFSSDTTPLWSSHLLARPDLADTLRCCQADFCRAGVDVLETATYQLSPAGLARTHVLPDFPDGIVKPADVAHILNEAVVVAEAASKSSPSAASPPSLALSLGPYGACMIPSTEYSGIYDHDGRDTAALRHWHAHRLHLFVDGVPRLAQRVRSLAFETLPRLDEIVAVRQLYSDDANATNTIPSSLSTLSYWISCVFPGDDPAVTPTLPDGTTAEQAVTAMLSPATGSHIPWGIGINCTKIGRLAGLVERYEATVASLINAGKLAEWPALVLYPDGTNGEVYNTTTQQWEMPPGAPAPEAPWETRLAKIVQAAASSGKWREILVGGCCKTTDRDIRALKDILKGSS